jgi:hypothetical protein
MPYRDLAREGRTCFSRGHLRRLRQDAAPGHVLLRRLGLNLEQRWLLLGAVCRRRELLSQREQESPARARQQRHAIARCDGHPALLAPGAQLPFAVPSQLAHCHCVTLLERADAVRSHGTAGADGRFLQHTVVKLRRCTGAAAAAAAAVAVAVAACCSLGRRGALRSALLYGQWVL